MSINHLQSAPSQPVYYAPQQTNQFQNAANQEMLWVQGIEGAKAYLLAPGRTVPLWDSEEQCIYIKSTSPSGVPQPLTILDYTIRQPENEVETPQIDTSQFASREEFESLKDMISDLRDSIVAMQKPQHYTNKKGVPNNAKQSSL